MKQSIFKMLFLSVFLGIVVWACKDEFSNLKIDDRTDEIENARAWYDASQLESIDLKSRGINFNVIAVPNWDEAYRRQNKRYKTVEVPLNTAGKFSFLTTETRNRFKDNNPDKKRLSMTRLVIRTDRKTQERIVFLMTIIPSVKSLERSNYNPYRNTYITRDKDFDGHIIYHNLNGNFEHGWKYEDGAITHSVKNSVMDMPLRLKSEYLQCTTYEYTVLVEECTEWHTVTEWGDDVTGETCIYYSEVRDTWITCIWIDDEDDPYYGGGGDGGYVPPSPPQYGSLDYIVDSISMNQNQINKLVSEFEIWREMNCMTGVIYDFLVAEGASINFNINPVYGEDVAFYDPKIETISFGSEAEITAQKLEEEMFHAYQDYYYPTGIDKYLEPPYFGRSNIEFEVKFGIQLVKHVATDGSFADYGSAYMRNLIFSLAEYYNYNGEFPSGLTDIELGNYYLAVNDFRQTMPYPYNSPVDYNLKPDALFNILRNVSDCIQY